MEHRLDASGKVLGRLASEIAVLLRGKSDPRFLPRAPQGNGVVVYNIDGMKVTGKKMAQKLYRRHSGYHGGLKEEQLERAFLRDSRWVLRHAVLGMLPKNKWRMRLIKNLKLHRGEEK